MKQRDLVVLLRTIFLIVSFAGGLFYSFADLDKSITNYGGMAWVALSLALLFLSRFGTRRERAAVTVPVLLLQGIILYWWGRFPKLNMGFFWMSEPVTIHADPAVSLHIGFLLLGLLYLITELHGPRTEETPE